MRRAVMQRLTRFPIRPRPSSHALATFAAPEKAGGRLEVCAGHAQVGGRSRFPRPLRAGQGFDCPLASLAFRNEKRPFGLVMLGCFEGLS